MKKFLWKTTGTIVNLGCLALFLYGTQGNSCLLQTASWNLGKFVIWLTFLLSFIVMLGLMADPKKIKEIFTKNEYRSLPRWIGIPTDIVGIIILAGTGHPWYAGMWTFQALIEAIAKQKEDRP
jgi:hypothetical protein